MGYIKDHSHVIAYLIFGIAIIAALYQTGRVSDAVKLEADRRAYAICAQINNDREILALLLEESLYRDYEAAEGNVRIYLESTHERREQLSSRIHTDLRANPCPPNPDEVDRFFRENPNLDPPGEEKG